MGDNISGDERFFTPRNSARQGGYASSGDENFATPRSGRNSSRHHSNLSDNESDFVTPREGDRGESNDEGFYSGRDESYSQRGPERDGRRAISMPYSAQDSHQGEHVQYAPYSGGYTSQSPGRQGGSPWSGAVSHTSQRMSESKQEPHDYSHHDYRQYDYRNQAEYKGTQYDQWTEPNGGHGYEGTQYTPDEYAAGGTYASHSDYDSTQYGYHGAQSPNHNAWPPEAKQAWADDVTSGMSRIQINDSAHDNGMEAKVHAAAEGDWDVEEIFSLARHNRGDQVEFLLDNGVPVDVRDRHGNTILSVACQNGLKRMAKIALRRGADINSQNYKGNTPLHFCHAFGYGDSLGTYIISKGADPSCRNHFGLLPSEGIGGTKTPR